RTRGSDHRLRPPGNLNNWLILTCLAVKPSTQEPPEMPNFVRYLLNCFFSSSTNFFANPSGSSPRSAAEEVVPLNQNDAVCFIFFCHTICPVAGSRRVKSKEAWALPVPNPTIKRLAAFPCSKSTSCPDSRSTLCLLASCSALAFSSSALFTSLKRPSSRIAWRQALRTASGSPNAPFTDESKTSTTTPL